MGWKMASFVLIFVLEIHVTLPIDSDSINVATWRNATITLEKNDHELKHLFQGNWNRLWLHQVIKIVNNSSEEITKLLCSSSYHDHKYQNVDPSSGRHIIKIIFTRSVSATYLRFFMRIRFHSKFLLPFLPFDSVSIMYASFIDLFFLFIWTLFERHYPKKDTSGFRWSRVCFFEYFCSYFRCVENFLDLHGNMTFFFHQFWNHFEWNPRFFWWSQRFFRWSPRFFF